ncbi:MAG: hypothetical protein QM630_01700 [Microbacterium sp.]
MTGDPAERIRRACDELERWRVERDAAIRDAAGGEPRMNPTDIARASGLSRMQVYRILDGVNFASRK